MTATLEEKQISIDDIVSELKNPEQENTVRLKENACVSAGAGSGKTRVLATRYVYLVAKYGYLPSEILTLTYTNKAANEMYSRIYKSLIEYSEKITNPQELKNIKNAIEKFQDSKIQTLDSYSKAVVSSNVHKFGISPDFSLDKEQLESVVNQKAVEYLLKHRNNPYLQFFLGTNTPEKFAEDFFADIILNHSTISNPIDFEDGLKKQLEFAKETWQKLAKKANQLLVDTKKTYKDFGNNGTKSVRPIIDELMKKIDLTECEENPELLKESESIKFWYKWMSTFSGLNANYTKELGPHVAEAKSLLEKMVSFFNFIFYEEELKGISELLRDFQVEVENVKRGMGLLTFADVATLGIECLLRFPEVRQMEKKSYKAIMIDEFQDDNILQKELLYLLAEKEELCSENIPLPENLNPQKLFFVGDEKQSIYKFRGADVEVFRKLSDELKGKANLSTNYRSEPALVAGFNTIFGGAKYPIASEKAIADYMEEENPEKSFPPVFKENSYDLEKYEAAYNMVKAAPSKLENPDYQARMHFVLVNKEKTQPLADKEYYSELETEALFVATKIKELVKSKKYEPKDIAILFRSTTNQHIFERFLKLQGIPYSCGKQKGFFYDAPVNDILSLLKVVLFTSDLLSLSNYLTSPFVRLSNDTTNRILSILVKEKIEKKSFTNLFRGEKFLEIKNQLPKEEQDKFQNAKEIVEELRDFIKNHNIAETISKIFVDFGYCYETMWNNSVSIYSDLYDYLFALAIKADKNEGNLTDFLTSLEKKERNPREMDDISIPLERGNAVQLMTIHGSKGLEFPVVFVVGINGKGQGTRNDKRSCFHEKFGVAVNLPFHPMLKSDTKKSSWVFELTREEENKKEIAETRRVLYVAITRAEKEIYLTGHYSKLSGSEKKTVNFFDLLRNCVNKYVSSENDEKIAIEGSPFTYKEIEIAEKTDFTGDFKNQNTAENRIALIAEKSKIYETVPIEVVPNIPLNIVNPSKHETTKDLFDTKDFSLDEDYSKYKMKFANLPTDEIIKKKKKKSKTEKTEENEENEIGFTAKNFGTMAHAYIEHYFKEKNLSKNKEPKLPAVILEKLSPTEIEIVKKDAKLLATSFIESELGKKAYNSSWVKSEYDFKMAVEKNQNVYIVDGQIDLIFRDDETGKIIVIDFKSDPKIEPEKHYEQLAIYKKVAAELGNVDISKVETKLYYLRYGL